MLKHRLHGAEQRRDELREFRDEARQRMQAHQDEIHRLEHAELPACGLRVGLDELLAQQSSMAATEA